MEVGASKLESPEDWGPGASLAQEKDIRKRGVHPVEKQSSMRDLCRELTEGPEAGLK